MEELAANKPPSGTVCEVESCNGTQRETELNERLPKAEPTAKDGLAQSSEQVVRESKRVGNP